jgi:hypothetical protein
MAPDDARQLSALQTRLERLLVIAERRVLAAERAIDDARALLAELRDLLAGITTGGDAAARPTRGAAPSGLMSLEFTPLPRRRVVVQIDSTFYLELRRTDAAALCVLARAAAGGSTGGRNGGRLRAPELASGIGERRGTSAPSEDAVATVIANLRREFRTLPCGDRLLPGERRTGWWLVTDPAFQIRENGALTSDEVRDSGR